MIGGFSRASDESVIAEPFSPKDNIASWGEGFAAGRCFERSKKKAGPMSMKSDTRMGSFGIDILLSFSEIVSRSLSGNPLNCYLPC